MLGLRRLFARPETRPRRHGLIATDDDKEFARALEAVRDKSNSLVFASGWGGNGIAGVLIGDMIRRAGISTVVLDGNDCASACALIWVAGARRIAGKNACIGFHGMYDAASGQQIADANAVAGGHLGLLGLSLDAIFWMLTPRQLDIHWLTDETAARYGVHWAHEKDDPGHSCPNERAASSPEKPPAESLPLPNVASAPVAGPAPQPEKLERTAEPTPIPQPATAANPTQEQRCFLCFDWDSLAKVTTSADLHLRQAGDPLAADVVGPDYRIARGSELILKDNCKVWNGSGRGAQDADNIWCWVRDGDYSGYVNGYYLVTSDGRRVACVLHPNARGCPLASQPKPQEMQALDAQPPAQQPRVPFDSKKVLECDLPGVGMRGVEISWGAAWHGFLVIDGTWTIDDYSFRKEFPNGGYPYKIEVSRSSGSIVQQQGEHRRTGSCKEVTKENRRF
jgi:hypothetical protein